METEALDNGEKAESEELPEAPGLPPPDVQPPEPKKRGRKPYPRDANGNIVRPDGTVSAAKPQSRSQQVKEAKEIGLTDENVGKAFSGAFMVTSIGLGAHWRLFPWEEKELGRAFGPLARKYPGKIEQYIDILMLAPVTAGIIVPRAMVHKMKVEGHIEPSDTRKTLLRVLTLMEAERNISLSEMAKEGEEALKEMAKAKGS